MKRQSAAIALIKISVFHTGKRHTTGFITGLTPTLNSIQYVRTFLKNPAVNDILKNIKKGDTPTIAYDLRVKPTTGGGDIKRNRGRPMKAHCLFEQSGTFKNEFKKLGYEAYDYDILNDYGQTDYQCDLYAEIKGGVRE